MSELLIPSRAKKTNAAKTLYLRVLKKGDARNGYCDQEIYMPYNTYKDIIARNNAILEKKPHAESDGLLFGFRHGHTVLDRGQLYEQVIAEQDGEKMIAYKPVNKAQDEGLQANAAVSLPTEETTKASKQGRLTNN